MSSFYGNGGGGGGSSSPSFDLSDRLAKGIDNQDNIVDGAIIEGTITGDNKNIASGTASHAEGNNTIANHKSQHVFGEYNIEDNSSATASNRGNYVEIVGNGTEYTRSNARTLDWSGNEKLAGSLTLGIGTADETTITATELASLKALNQDIESLLSAI